MSKKIYFQYTPPTKTAWDELPMDEKTDIMKSCIRNGIISLQDVRTAYNNYAAGRNIYDGIPDYQANAAKFGNFLAGGGKKETKEKPTPLIKVGQPYYNYDNNGRKIDDTLYYNVDVILPEVVVTPTREPVGLDRLAKGINYNSNRTVGESARKAGEGAVREQRRRIEEAVARFNQQNEMHTVFPIGEVGDLPVLRMKKDPKVIGMSGTDPVGEFVVATAALNPAFKAAETAGLFGLGRYGSRLGLDAEQNWARSVLVNREMSKPTIGIHEGFLTIKPNKRTRVGDVEINNPNLLYHLDRGNSAGAFSNQGAYVENGVLFPGIAKREGQLGYSWWNEGKPYATSVKSQPMTRLMTATKDTPGMLQVRSQNYPIGQWTGSKGFVLPSEYVNSEGVNVSGSTYTLDPNYGWRKLFENTPTAQWMPGNASYLNGKPEIGMYFPDGKTFDTTTFAKDLGVGIADARLFLGSEVKRASDVHNIELAKRIGLPQFMPYAKAQERASVYVKPQLTANKSAMAGSVEKNTNNPALDKMTINVLYDADKGGFHETLHRGNYGEAGYFYEPETMDFMPYHQIQDDTRGLYDFKTKKLLVPKTEENAEWHDYMSRSAEAAANSMELGRRMGLRPGAPWPGRKKAMELFEKYASSEDQKTKAFNVLNWRQKPRRVWDALTGRYFVLGAGTLSTTSLIDN